jgi:hypothetical protein
VARLRRTGVYDRALLVLTSDHGASFRAHDRRRDATRTNLADVAFVPLVVKRPGQQAGRVVDRHVETTQILPTIAKALGVRVSSWTRGGVSLFDERGAAADVIVGRDEGGVLRASTTELLRRRAAAVRRKLHLFGTDERAFFGRPQTRVLIGRAAAAAHADRAALTADLHQDEFVSGGDAPVPALVSGDLAGDAARGGVDLAIAVNGRIAATTRSFETGLGVRFATLVPERVLRDGRNRVAVYRVAGGGRMSLLGNG